MYVSYLAYLFSKVLETYFPVLVYEQWSSNRFSYFTRDFLYFFIVSALPSGFLSWRKLMPRKATQGISLFIFHQKSWNTEIKRYRMQHVHRILSSSDVDADLASVCWCSRARLLITAECLQQITPSVMWFPTLLICACGDFINQKQAVRLTVMKGCVLEAAGTFGWCDIVGENPTFGNFFVTEGLQFAVGSSHCDAKLMFQFVLKILAKRNTKNTELNAARAALLWALS